MNKNQPGKQSRLYRVLWSCALVFFPALASFLLLHLTTAAADWLLPSFAPSSAITQCFHVIAFLGAGASLLFFWKHRTKKNSIFMFCIVAIPGLLVLEQAGWQLAHIPPLAFAGAAGCLVISAVAIRGVRKAALLPALFLLPALLESAYLSAVCYALSMLNP